MYKKSRMFAPVISLLMGLAALLTFMTLFFDYTLFLISASITLVVFAVLFFLIRGLVRRGGEILRDIGDGILYTGEKGFIDSPIPVITVYDFNEIIWHNDACLDGIFDGEDMRGRNIAEAFPGLDVTDRSPPEGRLIARGGRLYTAFISVTERETGALAVIYLIDDTDLKRFATEYHLSRPSIALITVDNYEELAQDYKESERSQLMGEIEAATERYISENHGFTIRIERDKLLSVIEERGLAKMIAGKFGILDKVRATHAEGRMPATISIGVGSECENLHEALSAARQALDMCLGRGGDQVAVRSRSGYDFYGGLSKGIEKRTKVKTRIIANALYELIESSGNVVLMGHRFADLDALGSCVGMLRAVREMGKHAVICIDPQKNLVKPMLDRLLESGSYSPGDFMPPDKVMEFIGGNTLLIILDTHVPHVLESEPVYRACKNVVVIDHHRKLVSHIDDAVIFYHEPFASSASEMVAELVQYFPSRPRITKLEAEAMLSGIMLDTKNFLLRTGARTFEAAAYLKRMGADTSQVRKLFANTMECYKHRASFVSGAEIYRKCAITSSEEEIEDVKTIAPQAADELMTISGVDASFVIYIYQDVVNVSARSMGEINVQLIMEKLGGGGHNTMAAAQFPGENIENIRGLVMRAIDGYYASLSTPEPEKKAKEEPNLSDAEPDSSDHPQ